MKIRHALTGVAAAALFVVGGSGTAVAATASPPASTGAEQANGTTSTSSASTWDQYFQDFLYGYCLDDSSGLGLRMTTCSNASYDNGYQKWAVTQNGGYYKFQNWDTHLCLDGSIGDGVEGNTCSTASYDNGYQKWTPVYSASASSGAIFVAWENVKTGLCLDYSLGDHLQLKPCSLASFDNGYQAWFLREFV